MLGYRFTEFIPEEVNQDGSFEDLLKVFMQLIVMTNGDAAEALAWMSNLDAKYGLTGDGYGMGDFIEDLKKKGYLEENEATGKIELTAKSEQAIRKSALEEILAILRKAREEGT